MDRSRLEAALVAVEQALKADLSPVLSQEKTERKDAALVELEAAMPSQVSAEDALWLAGRLQGLMAGNRHSLRWTQLRSKLAMIGAPKAAPVAERAKLDLVI